MGRRTRITMAVGAAVALGVPGTGAAQTAEPAPTTEPAKTKYFFKCDGPSKLQNPTLVAGTRSWSTTAPTTSFTAGAGCGWLDAPVGGGNGQTIYDAVFGGKHGGAIASIKVELHNLLLGRVTENAFLKQLRVRLNVDGTEYVPNVTVPVTPVLSSTGLTQKVEFEVKGLAIPSGLDSRSVILTIDNAGGAAWVMDASEVPSSIEFTEPAPVAAPAAP